MLCKCCRSDLPKESFSDAEYRQAVICGATRYCLQCSPLTKKQKKAKIAAVVALFAPAHPKRRRGKKAKQNKGHEWSGLSGAQKHEQMLKNRTPSEIRLGVELEREKIPYQPQARAGCYFVDIQILPGKLAVEVDGSYHDDEAQKKKDASRTRGLTKMGWTVIRFTNAQVKTQLPQVIAEIKAAMQPKPAPPPKLIPLARQAFTPKVIVVHPSKDFPFGANMLDAIARDDWREERKQP